MSLVLDFLPEPSIDTKPHQAEQVRRLLNLARFLPSRDLQLVRATLVHGQPVGSLARMLGLPRLKLQRRVTRLVRRLGGPRYRLAARHFRSLTPAERWWAKRWVFAGLSLRALSAERGISVHQVRKRLAGLSAKLARLDLEPHR